MTKPPKRYEADLAYEDVATELEYNPETGELRWLRGHCGSRKVGKIAGCVSASGYRVVRMFGRLFYAHRVAWLLHHREWPPLRIDHIDGNKTNNRIRNLRLATQSQNLMNVGVRSHNTSGVRGVFLTKGRRGFKPYRADLGGKTIGYYGTLDEAARAREKAARAAFGEFYKP